MNTNTSKLKEEFDREITAFKDEKGKLLTKLEKAREELDEAEEQTEYFKNEIESIAQNTDRRKLEDLTIRLDNARQAEEITMQCYDDIKTEYDREINDNENIRTARKILEELNRALSKELQNTSKNLKAILQDLNVCAADYFRQTNKAYNKFAARMLARDIIKIIDASKRLDA